MTTRELLLSSTRSEIASAVSRGQILRVRRGWFAAPDADERIVRAVRIGGRAACESALLIHGLWTWSDGRLHVQVQPHSARLRVPARGVRSSSSAHLHWTPYSVIDRSDGFCAPVAAALHQLIRHGDLERSVVALDSAINRGLLNGRGILALRESVPLHLAPVFELVDGSAESGIESLTRIRLRARGIPLKTQVRVLSGIRVDLLVGDRLVIECDGREFHDADAFDRDRERDITLKGLGFEVLRLSYGQVMNDWMSAELAILAMIDRGQHQSTSQLRSPQVKRRLAVPRADVSLRSS